MRDKKILIVDDSAAARQTLSKLCSGLALDMDIASNYEEALIQFQEKRHDFILTDYILPDASGIDLIIEARKIDPEVPALILTAFPDERVRSFIEETSNCRFILKPLQFIELVHELILGMQIKTGQVEAVGY